MLFARLAPLDRVHVIRVAAGADLQAGARPGRRAPGPVACPAPASRETEHGQPTLSLRGARGYAADPPVRLGVHVTACGCLHGTPAVPPTPGSAMLRAMPGIGIAQGADAASAAPLRWRDRFAALTDSSNARHVLGVIAARRCSTAAPRRSATRSSSPARWPRSSGCPSGVGIAFLYLGGLRFWPGVLVGDLLANDYSALPLGSALGQTAGNVLEVVVATVAAARGSCRAATRSGASRGVGADARRDRRGHRGQRDGRLAARCCSAAWSRRTRSRTCGAPGGSATPPAR